MRVVEVFAGCFVAPVLPVSPELSRDPVLAALLPDVFGLPPTNEAEPITAAMRRIGATRTIHRAGRRSELTPPSSATPTRIWNAPASGTSGRRFSCQGTVWAGPPGWADSARLRLSDSLVSAGSFDGVGWLCRFVDDGATPHRSACSESQVV